MVTARAGALFGSCVACVLLAAGASAQGVVSGGSKSKPARPLAGPSPRADADLWVPDGFVQKILVDGGSAFVSGTFSHFGRYTGSAAVIDASTGIPSMHGPKIDGEIRALAADGAGGLFAAGGFTLVGSTALKNLARLRPDGTLDAWSANVDGGVVSAIARAGSTLYVAGTFFMIG